MSVAIVGSGKFSDDHVREIRKINGVTVVAVCDKEELMAQQLAERYRIPHQFTSLNAMYEEIRPTVVHIVTPPQTHLQIGRYACERGSHIYVEKPFAVNYAEAAQLIDAANSFDRKVTVGNIYHFDPPAMQMRRLVAAGILGEPVHIEATWSYDLGGSYGQAFLTNYKHWIYNLPGGLFHNIISHLVEKVLEFMPDHISSVKVCSFLRSGELKARGINILDELRVILAGENVTASLTFSCNLKPTYSFLRVHGTKNTIEVDFDSRSVIIRRGKQLPTMLGKIATGFDIASQYQRSAIRNLVSFLRNDFHYFDGMNYLLNSFYSSIRDGRDPPISYSDILRTTKIMDMIFEQLPHRQSTDTQTTS